MTIESSSSPPSSSSSCLHHSKTYGVTGTRHHCPVNYACDYSFTVEEVAYADCCSYPTCCLNNDDDGYDDYDDDDNNVGDDDND
ncbi:hypothetical protein ElyMa_006938800 [Elysia marginata]|uniref:Uncharacterized protein n=1 Tax=Elysia marginata TaxID=1093978 RepID=A0AAV4JGS9_9GAST|nr:hypothetical protein ElyMa_006938800 [Elysia marginata]